MLVDANLLLYARDDRSPFHEAAQTWLTGRLNGPVRIGLPWLSLVAFVRISTHPRAYESPLTPGDAFLQVQEWLGAPASWIPSPTEAHPTIFGTLVERHDLRGNLITDAHLAALAIEHGLTLCSADTDFARFDELRWIDPVRPRSGR